jgi:O-antigen/teichoic acid export membrane protein
VSSLGNKTFTGSLWVIFSMWVIRFFGVISTAILARIFTPEDFGIVAIALLVMAFLEVILQNGTENYLIRKDEINSSFRMR